MGSLEQKIIDFQLKEIKKRPEYIRGVEDRELALEQHGVIERIPKERSHKVLRPAPRKRFSNKIVTPNPVIPEQVDLFRNEEGKYEIIKT